MLKGACSHFSSVIKPQLETCNEIIPIKMRALSENYYFIHAPLEVCNFAVSSSRLSLLMKLSRTVQDKLDKALLQATIMLQFYYK